MKIKWSIIVPGNSVISKADDSNLSLPISMTHEYAPHSSYDAIVISTNRSPYTTSEAAACRLVCFLPL